MSGRIRLLVGAGVLAGLCALVACSVGVGVGGGGSPFVEFTIGGKKFGPYYSFCRDQLDPHPDDPDWQGTRYPASGVAYCTSIGGDYRYGREGCRSYYCRIPWSIRGVCDDTDNDVRLFLYMDKFGPSRRGNLVYNNWYVYDCHFPEGWRVYLGSTDNMNAKLATWEAIRSKILQNNYSVQEIDVRYNRSHWR